MVVVVVVTAGGDGVVVVVVVVTAGGDGVVVVVVVTSLAPGVVVFVVVVAIGGDEGPVVVVVTVVEVTATRATLVIQCIVAVVPPAPVELGPALLREHVATPPVGLADWDASFGSAP